MDQESRIRCGVNRKTLTLIALPLLLLAWGALWMLSRSSSINTASQAAPVSKSPSLAPKKELPPETSNVSQGSPDTQPTEKRDPFEVPDQLKEILRRREEERLKKQHEAEEAAKAALEARPMEHIAAALVALPNLSVQGILWGDEPKVIINHKILKVGDTIEGAQITRITREGVTAQFQGQNFTLPLATSQKKPSREGPPGPGRSPYQGGGPGEGYGPARQGGR